MNFNNNFFKNKFDVIISIGEDCACSSYLRKFNLQNYSYPFDWLTNAPFINRINLICNNFNNFFNIEDIELMTKPTEFESDPNHDYYKNNNHFLYFWHDFPTGVDFNEAYLMVKEKYDRRIKRLYQEIEKSNKILFVWLSQDKYQDKELIQDAYKKLLTKFNNKEIFILLIENSDKFSQILLNNGHILLLQYDNLSDDGIYKYNPTLGNQKNNLKIFKKIIIRKTLPQILNQIFYNILFFFAKLIPYKPLRHNVKSSLNMYFYHAKL